MDALLEQGDYPSCLLQQQQQQDEDDEQDEDYEQQDEQDDDEDSSLQEDLAVDIDAPEKTKLFFANINGQKHWEQLKRAYVNVFGQGRINKNGTMFLPAKRVGYINFFNKHDMEEGLKMEHWKPREASQVPGLPDPIPRFPAFAVGFENWHVTVIKDLAKKLLGASEFHPKESVERPGVCVGSANVGFDTEEKLLHALMKKKFVLKCKNAQTIITLKPHHKSPISLKRKLNRQRMNQSQMKHVDDMKNNVGINTISASASSSGNSNGDISLPMPISISNPFGSSTENCSTADQVQKIKLRENTIHVWIKNEIISKAQGKVYLRDCREELKKINTKHPETYNRWSVLNSGSENLEQHQYHQQQQKQPPQQQQRKNKVGSVQTTK